MVINPAVVWFPDHRPKNVDQEYKGKWALLELHHGPENVVSETPSIICRWLREEEAAYIVTNLCAGFGWTCKLPRIESTLTKLERT